MPKLIEKNSFKCIFPFAFVPTASKILIIMTIWYTYARIQEFSSGGGGDPGQFDKKKLWQRFLFSPQLILQKSNGQFQRNLSFFKVPEGVQHFPGGGGPTYSRGGGGGPNAYYL